jgi:hypothetical protein
MHHLKAIWLGLKRRPGGFLVSMFLAYSAIWTVVESAAYFLVELKLQGGKYYLTLLLLSIFAASARAYQRSRIQFKVGHSNTAINVYFGDLFSSGGYQAIPVNEYFDSELGLPVSPNSLHGIVLERFFGGHPAAFDQLVSTDLAGKTAKTVTRTGGKSLSYPIGTTASIRTRSHHFLLFALCTTEQGTFKASAGLSELVTAFEGLCARARLTLGGEKLVVPLAGSGLAGIGLPPQHLLQVILLLLVNESKKAQFALEVDVVLHPGRFEEIDLHLIEALWR